MWEKKQSPDLVKTTQIAVRKIADKKLDSINQTADWMRKYLYAEWPKNPDTVELETKNKILAALAEEIRQEPEFTAWVLFQVAGDLAKNREVKAIWE